MTDVIKSLSLCGIIPVIKLDDPADAIPLCTALKDGGLPVAEITFRTAAAEESIKRVSEALPDVIVGAGTVMTIDQAERAVKAGAKFIVSAGFNPDVVKWCVDAGVPITPGVNSPAGVEQAYGYGLRLLKFFPAEASGGLKFIKAISAPYNMMRFIPTGGINEDNLKEYLAFDKIAACGGSWMVPQDAIKAKDFNRIKELTASAVYSMLGFTVVHIGINTENDEEARRVANMFAAMFNFPIKEGSSSVFASSGIEVMKSPFLGAKGHIAIRTNSIERAMHFLEGKGFAFNMESEKKNAAGKTIAIYFKDEIAGFALHLLQA
ncbi:MAG: bifunctional 4-hydroxy-2-oxoglutarate aldolase/2-dehydro-3-deoxy-phosphogluconate aldolase [Christensenellales bacterium]|jgi:2-dehydro-3-deoxyphosphogluconate aldolase/(4S)-4-hydroxy-2-oxoglutarate aldolase